MGGSADAKSSPAFTVKAVGAFKQKPGCPDFAAAGLDAGRIRTLMAEVNVRSIKVDEKGGESESGFLETFFTSYIALMMLMFMVVTVGATPLISSVLEEKMQRIAEVQQGTSADDLARVDRLFGVTQTTVARAIAGEADYCSDERIAYIRGDLTRHLAGDFTPGRPRSFAKDEGGLLSFGGETPIDDNRPTASAAR